MAAREDRRSWAFSPGFWPADRAVVTNSSRTRFRRGTTHPRSSAVDTDWSRRIAKIIGCAYHVANGLGCGCPEKVYENDLRIERRRAGLRICLLINVAKAAIEIKRLASNSSVVSPSSFRVLRTPDTGRVSNIAVLAAQ